MTAEEKLVKFYQAIEDWKSSKYLAKVESPPEAEEILNASSGEIKNWNSEECNIGAYKLYAYAEYIETERVKEETTLEWADSSIWFVISTSIDNYGSQYAKWQQKYYSAIKENPLASELLIIKNHAEARVKILDGKHNRIMKMADTLNNLARRK